MHQDILIQIESGLMYRMHESPIRIPAADESKGTRDLIQVPTEILARQAWWMEPLHLLLTQHLPCGLRHTTQRGSVIDYGHPFSQLQLIAAACLVCNGCGQTP